jgi:aminoglycoside phosphotransferase (APT) family kinase protein
MAKVDGANPTVDLPAIYHDDPAAQRRLCFDIVEHAATLGNLDYVELGLASLGKPDGFLARQVDRWQAQLDSYASFANYPNPQIPGLQEVASWLRANMPQPAPPGIIHGDFHLANLMVSANEPGVAALVDWELTTIGDPLLDLAWMINAWPDPAHPDEGIVTHRMMPFAPSPDEMVAHYHERSGRDVSAMPWYEVLGCYKLGIILEGTFARACAGLATMETGVDLHARTLGLFQRALARMGDAA